MRTPMNNWQGFNATSILVNSASLQRNHGETNFLLIHGTGHLIVSVVIWIIQKVYLRLR